MLTPMLPLPPVSGCRLRAMVLACTSLFAAGAQADAIAVLRASELRARPDAAAYLLGHVREGAVVDTTGGRFGPWVQVRVRTGPTGWVQSLDLNLPAPAGSAPSLPESAKYVPHPAPPATPNAMMDAAVVSPSTPGMAQLVQAQTYALATEPARAFGFMGGLELVKLPRAARRVPANATEPAPIEPTDALERTMGQSHAAKLLAGRQLVAQVPVQHYINLLGRWLSAESTRPDLDWTFGVLDDASFDAFSAPGGYVFVTQGLLDRVDNEAELAAVLAREIAMVADRYHLRGGVLHTPGLADQLEADVLATELLARTGMEPGGLRSLLTRMADVGYFNKSRFAPMLGTEPNPKARLANLSAVVGTRFDNLEPAPARRIPDRLTELQIEMAAQQGTPQAARQLMAQ